METEDVFANNRVILSHFDGYSAALVFARFGRGLLLPEALPLTATPMRAPAAPYEAYSGDSVLRAAQAKYGLSPEQVVRLNGFDEWMLSEAGPIRIHLLRFNTFLAPAESIARHGGVFVPISGLRGSAQLELGLVRQAFNLMMTGEASS